MLTYDMVNITPLRGRKFRVNNAIPYRGIVVPKGFITNGADVPRMFWSFIPPNDTDILPAVIIHDYLCSIREYKLAEMLFKTALYDLKVSRLKIFILTSATQFYAQYIRKDNNA